MLSRGLPSDHWIEQFYAWLGEQELVAAPAQP